jgi:hypothetical protein
MSDQVDVDPKLAAAIAAWATVLAMQAIYASGDEVPGWVGTVVASLYDWSDRLARAEGQARGTAGQADTTQPTSAAGAHGAFLRGVLSGAMAPVAPPPDPLAAPPPIGSLLEPEPPATGWMLLDELHAARLAVGAADALAAAQRAGDAEQVACWLAVFERASRIYHAAAGQRLGRDADEGAGP